MVTGTHPEDVELFDYVEDELSPGRRAELETHLATCARCAEHVARVQAGRDALRGAQFLELPAARREAILRDLPERRAAAGRVPWLSAKRLVAVLATVALVAAAVVAVVTTGGTSGEEAAATGTGGGAAAEFSPQDRNAAAAPLRAPGPTAPVAAELRRRGFDAAVVGDHVEVRGATRAQVKRALERLRTTALTKQRVRIVVHP